VMVLVPEKGEEGCKNHAFRVREQGSLLGKKATFTERAKGRLKRRWRQSESATESKMRPNLEKRREKEASAL